MNKRKLCLTMFLLLACSALWAGDAKTEGKFLLGTTYTDVDGYVGKVGEYELAEQGFLPLVKARLTVLDKDLFLDVVAVHKGDAREQFYQAYFDASRVFKTRFTMNKFQHRLDHDPLLNMDTSQRAGHMMNTADDLAPAHEYRIVYTEYLSETELRHPKAEWLSANIAYRRQEREGAHQGYALNHCQSCHLESMPRPVDEATDEVTASLAVGTPKAGLQYTLVYREFKEHLPNLEYTYERAVHPGTQLDVFTNRVLFDDTNGAIPTNAVPGNKKFSHEVKGYYNPTEKTSLIGALNYAEVENGSTALSAITRSYSGRFSAITLNNTRINARYRYTNIDNAATYVDLVENTAVAGPQRGLTYQQAYPSFGPADFVRYSALSRENSDFDLEFLVPFANRSRLGITYNYQNIQRDTFEVSETEKHKFDIFYRTDPRKNLNGTIRYKMELVSDPFANHQAAIEPVMQPTPSPGAAPFVATQYFELYDARMATLTNQPTQTYEIDGLGTWKPAEKFGFTVHYNYKDSDNDALDYSDWSQTVQTVSGDLWFTPEERFTLTAGIMYTDYKSETLFVLPVWNG